MIDEAFLVAARNLTAISNALHANTPKPKSVGPNVAAHGAKILGYYSLAMSAIRKDQLPLQYQSRFPNYPLPVARLVRLAVDHRYQKRGLGELLLADALSRCLRLSEEIGMVGVVVDAKHEQARNYYERFEFEGFPDSPLTLWLPTAAIAKL